MNVFQSLLKLTAILMKIDGLKHQFRSVGDNPTPEAAIEFTINAREFFRDLEELKN